MSLRLKNRRKRPDLVLRLLTLSHASAVIALFAALCVTAVAKPELETFFDRYYGLPIRQTWDMDLASYIGIMLFLSCLASIAGLFLNSRRLRRKEDHIHITLILSLAVALIGLGYFVRLVMIHS